MAVLGEPTPRRRPSISTNVRFGPKPRKSAVATPPAVVNPEVRVAEILTQIVIEVLRQLGDEIADIGLAGYLDGFREMATIGLVLTSFGAAMRDPVTTTSSKAGSVGPGHASAGACCATAGISMAAMHTHADKTMVNRFTNDVTLSNFPILILVSPENDSHVAACLHVQNPRCGVATCKAHGHRPDAARQ